MIVQIGCFLRRRKNGTKVTLALTGSEKSPQQCWLQETNWWPQRETSAHGNIWTQRKHPNLCSHFLRTPRAARCQMRATLRAEDSAIQELLPLLVIYNRLSKRPSSKTVETVRCRHFSASLARAASACCTRLSASTPRISRTGTSLLSASCTITSFSNSSFVGK